MSKKNKKAINNLNDGEDDEINTKLDKIILSIKGLQNDVSKIQEIERSINYVSNEFDALKQEIRELKDGLKKERSDKNKINEQIAKQSNEIIELRENVEYLLAREKACEAEMKGIPKVEGEELKVICIRAADKSGMNIKENDIKDMYRVNGYNGKGEIITVKFHDEKIRDEFVQKCRKARLSLSDLKLGQQEPVYVNESLTWAARKLFNDALAFKKKKQYKFYWVKRGRVFLRQDHGSKIMVIKCASDLPLD